jgi:hypothetical protein
VSDLPGLPLTRTQAGSDRGSVWSWLPLVLTVALFVAISTAYNVVVPVYEAPDEKAHARYVITLAEEGRLSEFDHPEDYEAWQPPLYYALGAALLKLLALESPPLLEPNLSFPVETASLIHAPDEGFPYNEPILAAHLLRGLSTLFAAGAIVFIYLTALALFPGRRLLAWTAAATAGLVPQFAFIGGTVSNDAASVFFAAATVYFGMRYMGDQRFVWLFMSAVALSLGGLTKSTALIAGVVPLVGLMRSPMPWQERARYAAVLVLLPLAVGGWFYARSFIIWGALFPEHLFPPLNARPIWDPVYRTIFVPWLRDSYWYWGGLFNVRMSPILYQMLDFLSALAVAGVIVTFVSGRLSSFQRRGLLLLALLPILALAGILYFSVTVGFQPQGRYLFIAQPGLAILMTLGLSALFSRNVERDHPVIVTIPAVLLAMNVYILVVVLPRAY